MEVRLLKLTEEVGEVADAFLGVHGLNRRKGVCRTRHDLLDELSDVIITAAVAMADRVFLPARAAGYRAHRFGARRRRTGRLESGPLTGYACQVPGIR